MSIQKTPKVQGPAPVNVKINDGGKNTSEPVLRDGIMAPKVKTGGAVSFFNNTAQEVPKPKD